MEDKTLAAMWIGIIAVLAIAAAAMVMNDRNANARLIEACVASGQQWIATPPMWKMGCVPEVPRWSIDRHEEIIP